MSDDAGDASAFREALLADPRLAPILSDPARYRAQVLLTEVVETSGKGTDNDECPHTRHTCLRRHAFREDAEYFYPASTVKLFGAIAACVALRGLARTHRGLDLDTPLAFGARPANANEDGVLGAVETTEEFLKKNVTTLRAELAKLFVVSDNRAVNRCSDICGPSGIRDWTSAYLPGHDVRVAHRLFDRGDEPEGRNLGPFDLPSVYARVSLEWISILEKRKDDAAWFVREARDTRRTRSRTAKFRIGSSHVTSDGRLARGALDFSRKNRVTLAALQETLLLLSQPERSFGDPGGTLAETTKSTSEPPYLNLHPEDRAFVLRCMSAVPGDLARPEMGFGVTPEDASKYSRLPDHSPKFFQPGIVGAPAPRRRRSAPLDPRSTDRASTDRASTRTREVVITNKLGRAYGFSVDNARVCVVENDETLPEFYLAAVVQTNENGVLNDDAYEYETVADPFFANLAETTATFVWTRQANARVGFADTRKHSTEDDP